MSEFDSTGDQVDKPVTETDEETAAQEAPPGAGDLDTGTGESGGFGSDAGNTSESDSSFGGETGEFGSDESSADVENS